MREFKKPEHRIIAQALGLMDHGFLIANHCWFGGGTAIVLKLGEYRRSLDLDFLCADADGYRELRTAAVERGVRAFFPEPVEAVRDFQVDQYGLRTVVRLDDLPIRFEVVREGRISLQGHLDTDLDVPALILADMFAEKLLANADRSQDRAVAYRDALDIGMLTQAGGEIPFAAVEKTEAVYGRDIRNKATWVLNRLRNEDELRYAADTLQMNVDEARDALAAFRQEALRVWPDAGISKD
ncbi:MULTISPECIES: nucleotidyl transferase AbiEii/AbiGii toxin family protein [Mesorhizobium]|uniref:Nucleotidyl transferase AbiEii/AbiGii toxin family protein n=1 Tax=Mesorhizobium shonense TaxID=1209948 RepID=A0ABV2HL71_9HYPH|nr:MULTISPECIES: nucleotidyl transferase AbiEii/AbiGii toxin family protein [unclassified Mesorhizobium]AZO31319.1 hypothetical protein EJ071_30655 [Mesorhizobium sp. M1B.F.Ca.ET.045.04.1.1]RWA64654.1 MAG: hypothetical protein EOQ29_27935 [Mesorhizobium sp.]RWA82942.1 MAG: hypothetical protein EOQ30_14560 [Mesorhizobium sp.]RWB17295.1 MAG: hypothetical protein EOQ40_26005 [Mesorhizobium sp.]RWE00488.1 MAG: hypothetical protein EOS40_15495 [Mesorhizobium sp.]